MLTSNTELEAVPQRLWEEVSVTFVVIVTDRETRGVPVSTILAETEGVTATVPDAEVEMDCVLEAETLEDTDGVLMADLDRDVEMD